MGDCRYCGKPAGFLRKEHRECAERHASAQHRIRRLCVDAALHGGDLDSLPSRIREAASAASIEIRSHELPKLLATGWCSAVEAAMEDLALSAAEKRGLNRYRMRFDLDEGRLDGGGHFQMFRMMALLDSLTTDGVRSTTSNCPALKRRRSMTSWTTVSTNTSDDHPRWPGVSAPESP